MIRSFNGKSPLIHPTAFVSEAAYLVGDRRPFEHDRVRGDERRAADGRALVDDAAVAQQSVVANARGMTDDAVAERHVVADHG